MTRGRSIVRALTLATDSERMLPRYHGPLGQPSYLAISARFRSTSSQRSDHILESARLLRRRVGTCGRRDQLGAQKPARGIQAATGSGCA